MNACPVNLKTEFGSRFKIGLDPAHVVTGQTETERDWLFTIPCLAGGPGSHIYSHGHRGGQSALGLYFDGRGPLRTRLLDIPGVSLHVDFQDGYVLTFPLQAFNAVAEIVKPRTRRRLSEEQKKAHADRLKQWWFSGAGEPPRASESKNPGHAGLPPSDDGKEADKGGAVPENIPDAPGEKAVVDEGEKTSVWGSGKWGVGNWNRGQGQ